jgi:threonine dehydratase
MTGTGAVNERRPERPAAELIEAVDLAAASRAVAGGVVRTPTIDCPELGEIVGSPVALKAECLQRTGSFKLRGALSRISALGAPPEAGLVTASAGNHGRAVAAAAGLRGLRCEVFMPHDASVSKVLAVEGLGAHVTLQGASVDEALEQAIRRGSETGAAFVHPFDDLDVIAGQGTLGLELIEDVPDLARVIVPVGGGGLASGVGVALRRASGPVELVGVQAGACAPYADALADRAIRSATEATIADGIAIKRPGEITLPLVERWVDELVTVGEDDTAEAMVWLMERAKLVVEGAGAVGVAALLAGALKPAAIGSTVIVLSGGNVDAGLLAAIAQRHETTAGRRVRLFTKISDRPGGLAALLTRIADAGGNVVHADHVREAVSLHVRETGVELALETRSAEHGKEIVGALESAGYEVTRLDS